MHSMTPFAVALAALTSTSAFGYEDCRPLGGSDYRSCMERNMVELIQSVSPLEERVAALEVENTALRTRVQQLEYRLGETDILQMTANVRNNRASIDGHTVAIEGLAATAVNMFHGTRTPSEIPEAMDNYTSIMTGTPLVLPQFWPGYHGGHIGLRYMQGGMYGVPDTGFTGLTGQVNILQQHVTGINGYVVNFNQEPVHERLDALESDNVILIDEIDALWAVCIP